MIRFVNVSKAYLGGKQALQGLSFHLPVGGMSYLTGHSGAGKSTLLKLIMGIERANGGTVFFNGHDITRISAEQIPFLRRQIGMVHQDYRLLTDRSVLENVSLPLLISGMHPNEIKRRASAALDKVGLLHRANHLPLHLSGGEQQRVDIARAVVNRPQLLLADEPTGNLDSRTSQDVLSLMKVTGRKFSQTMVMITHNEEIAQLSDRIVRIEDGRIVTQ